MLLLSKGIVLECQTFIGILTLMSRINTTPDFFHYYIVLSSNLNHMLIGVMREKCRLTF